MTQLEALRLADMLENNYPLEPEAEEAAAELRRLHEENEQLRQALTQPEWVGLNLFEQTHLRTTYAPLKILHHDIKEDISVAAEVVADWGEFFAAIEAKLKEKNT